MAGRKRKADEDMAGDGDTEDRMSASPSNSPAPISRQLPHGQQRQIKRPKSSVTGRPLTLPRLLETLDAESMRTVLQSLCERHPELGGEVTSMAPRPSVASALSVLNQYESALRTAFPFGGNTGSDYAYNRVRQPLMDLLDALNDFTPHFLPPNETQTAVSLNFLDEGTNFIHRLPGWQTKHHNLHKENAYEEISKAWALVIKEASKRGGGIILQYGGWDQKIVKHDEQSGGKMHSVVSELSSSLGWFSPGQTSGSQQGNGGTSHSNDTSSIRQQLLSGTYGSNLPVRVGPW